MVSFLYLLGGTIMAQLFAIGVSPLLSRIYSPTDFGNFSLIVTVGYLVTAVACFRLDFAILSERNLEDKILLKNKAQFFLVINLVIIFFLGMVALLFGYIELEVILLFLFLVAASSLYNIYYNFILSFQNQKINFWGKLIQGGGGALSQLVLGLVTINYKGLLVGQILGLVYSVVYLKRNIENNVKKDKLFEFNKYKKFVFFDTFNHLFAVLSNHVSFLTIIVFYGTGFAGAFYMASRILLLPVSIVSVSISQFLTSRYLIWRDNGTLQRSLDTIFHFLLLMVFLPTICLSFIVEDMIVFILGSQWVESGKIIWFSILWIAPKFVFDSFSPLFSLQNYQKQSAIYQFLMNLTRVVTIIASFYLGLKGLEMIEIFSWIIGFFYICGLLYFLYVFKIRKVFLLVAVILGFILFEVLNMFNNMEIWMAFSVLVLPIWLYLFIRSLKRVVGVFNET